MLTNLINRRTQKLVRREKGWEYLNHQRCQIPRYHKKLKFLNIHIILYVNDCIYLHPDAQCHCNYKILLLM